MAGNEKRVLFVEQVGKSLELEPFVEALFLNFVQFDDHGDVEEFNEGVEGENAEWKSLLFSDDELFLVFRVHAGWKARWLCK